MSLRLKPILSKKELEIIEIIARFGYVSNPTIAHYLGLHQSANSMIKKLKEKAWVETKLLEKNKIIFLSKNAQDYFKLFYNGYVPYPSISKVSQSDLLHNSYEVKTFLLLNKLNQSKDSLVSDIKTERNLKPEFKKKEMQLKLNFADTARIPDGSFFYKGNHMVYEIEFTVKSMKRYFNIFHFYRDYFEYTRVLWLYKDPLLKANLIKKFVNLYYDDIARLNSNDSNTKIRLERNRLLHCFVEIDDFLKNGFNAKKEFIDDYINN